MTIKIRYAGVVVCDSCGAKQVIGVECREAGECVPIFETPDFWAKALVPKELDICPICVEASGIRSKIRSRYLNTEESKNYFNKVRQYGDIV